MGNAGEASHCSDPQQYERDLSSGAAVLIYFAIIVK